MAMTHKILIINIIPDSGYKSDTYGIHRGMAGYTSRYVSRALLATGRRRGDEPIAWRGQDTSINVFSTKTTAPNDTWAESADQAEKDDQCECPNGSA